VLTFNSKEGRVTLFTTTGEVMLSVSQTIKHFDDIGIFAVDDGPQVAVAIYSPQEMAKVQNFVNTWGFQYYYKGKTTKGYAYGIIIDQPED